MANTYLWSLMGLSVIFFTVMIQSIAAAIAHAKAPGAVPGKLCDNLSHDSFVFRSHRTFHNSLENLLIFAGPALIAMFAGVSEFTLSAIIWVYAIARVVHMLLYYVIATEKKSQSQELLLFNRIGGKPCVICCISVSLYRFFLTSTGFCV